ncbi:unnamed protein product, partial [Prorocentrum cordatum]
DVKKIVAEESGIQPEHMRLLYKGRLLKDALTLEQEGYDAAEPVNVLYTAGHTALVGGSQKQEFWFVFVAVAFATHGVWKHTLAQNCALVLRFRSPWALFRCRQACQFIVLFVQFISAPGDSQPI